jgi:Family of unknown function (DUF6404)
VANQLDRSFSQRLLRALIILRQTKMAEPNFAPPGYTLLWKFGIEIAPPHFLAWYKVSAMTGLPAAISCFVSFFLSAEILIFLGCFLHWQAFVLAFLLDYWLRCITETGGKNIAYLVGTACDS